MSNLTEDDERGTKLYAEAHSLMNNTPLNFLNELEEGMKYELINSLLDPDQADIFDVKNEIQIMFEDWRDWRDRPIENYNDDLDI